MVKAQNTHGLETHRFGVTDALIFVMIDTTRFSMSIVDENININSCTATARVIPDANIDSLVVDSMRTTPASNTTRNIDVGIMRLIANYDDVFGIQHRLGIHIDVWESNRHEGGDCHDREQAEYCEYVSVKLFAFLDSGWHGWIFVTGGGDIVGLGFAINIFYTINTISWRRDGPANT